MSLESIYDGQVRGTGSITSLPNYGNPPIFERDPGLIQLEQNIFQQMLNVLPQEPKIVEQPKQEVNFVSFEDALKELTSMNK
jgi:hypothetical protein